MPPDDFYWNATESESDESIPTDYHPLPLPNPDYHPLPLPIPDDKPTHIDPWDLENYAYIREHLDSMELSSNPASLPFSASSGSGGDLEATSFLYVPAGKSHRLSESSRLYDIDQGNYADIEEVKQEPRRTTLRRRGRGMSYASFEADTDESPYEEGLEGSVFGIYDRRGHFRKVSIPVSADYSYKPQLDRSMSVYEDYAGYDPYSTKHEIYSRLEDLPRNRSIPIYDDVRRLRRKPNNFGLTNYGHLKIDYSCNWNNLKKYIKNKH